MVTDVEIKSTFCRLMARGWVAGAKEVELPHLPGFKCIPDKEGDWELLDAYCVPGGGSFSWGFTTLWYQGVPVLTMSYGGQYQRRALKPLKRALSMAYKSGEFHGGRGRRLEVLDDNFWYDNNVASDFPPFFSGAEALVEGRWDKKEPQGQVLGFHSYEGAIFVPPT